MSKESRKAKKVFLKHGLCSLPVDVASIAWREGIELIQSPLDRDICGIYVVREGAKYIFVNRDHPPTRKRFTIAHELGHHFLHSGSRFISSGPTSGSPVYYSVARDGRPGVEETEANRFGACLLMPEEPLREMVGGASFLSEDFIKELATSFKVSPQAMTIRLVGLGIIDSF